MLRTDKIVVKLVDFSCNNSLNKVRTTLEEKLKEVASATKYTVVQTEIQIEVLLEEPISIPTVNKIFNAFQKERMIIYEFQWKRKKLGPFPRGYLEIIVS